MQHVTCHVRHARLQEQKTGLWSIKVPKSRKHVSVASLCTCAAVKLWKHSSIFPICFTADSFLNFLVFAIDEKNGQCASFSSWAE